MKLTQRSIASLNPLSAGDVFAWDDELPGFGIRVKPSGHKSYLIQYREGLRTRRMTLGACSLFKLEQARERARRMLVAAKDGKGPAAERDAAKAALTVRELSKRYLTEYAAHRKREELFGPPQIVQPQVQQAADLIFVLCKKLVSVLAAELLPRARQGFQDYVQMRVRNIGQGQPNPSG